LKPNIEYEHIYQETVRAVDNGAKFKIDFRRRSLKINGTYIIRDGKCDRELGVPPSTEDEFFAKMEELYRRYKHSVPSERSESKPCRYFKALQEKDLDDGDMLYGERRDKAQAGAGTVPPVPNTGRFQVESQDDGTLVLAEQDRQGPGDTPGMGEPNNNDH